MRRPISFNPWVVVFIGNALFHVWRGSIEDILIFGGAASLIMSQVLGLTHSGFKSQPKLPIWLIFLVVLMAATLLYLSPRHSLVSTAVLLTFVPIGIVLLFYKDPLEQPQPRAAVLRARLLWGIWAIVFALIELTAYLGSKMTGSLDRFPTISVLLDPVLDGAIGRAVFVALWLISGVYLFGVRRKQ